MERCLNMFACACGQVCAQYFTISTHTKQSWYVQVHPDEVSRQVQETCVHTYMRNNSRRAISATYSPLA